MSFVSSHLGALSHLWLRKVRSVQRRCHNCQGIEGGYVQTGLKQSLLGVLSPSDWQLRCAGNVGSRSLSKSLGHDGPCVLLRVPGEGKQVLGFLTKGDPQPGRTQIKDCGTLGGGRHSSQIVLASGTKANLGSMILPLDLKILD